MDTFFGATYTSHLCAGVDEIEPNLFEDVDM